MVHILAGRVALVTDGSRGLGAAIAKRLAQDGAAVALTYASSLQKAEEVVREVESAGGRALAIRADSGDVTEVRSAVAETVKAFGALDILVNSAGVLAMASIDEFKLADFDHMLAVNVRGIFGAIQEAVRHLKEGGRIMYLGSVNSDVVPFAGGSVSR
jgi:3-oxoacyl-[acyl-carrier protein] reductase